MFSSASKFLSGAKSATEAKLSALSPRQKTEKVDSSVDKTTASNSVNDSKSGVKTQEGEHHFSKGPDSLDHGIENEPFAVGSLVGLAGTNTDENNSLEDSTLMGKPLAFNQEKNDDANTAVSGGGMVANSGII